MFTRYVTQGAEEGFLISGPVRSQTLSSEGAAGVSFYYLLSLNFSQWKTLTGGFTKSYSL